MSTIQLQPFYGPDTLACPACGSQASVEWRIDVEGIDGPVEHLMIRCLDGHGFSVPAPTFAAAAFEDETGFLS